MIVALPTPSCDLQEPAPFDWQPIEGSRKLLCCRCFSVVNDIHRHWEGSSRNCENVQARKLIEAERCLAAFRGRHPASPYTQVVNAFNGDQASRGAPGISVLPVTASLIRIGHTGRSRLRLPARPGRVGPLVLIERIPIGESVFAATTQPWIDTWAWNVLDLKVLSPRVKKSILAMLLSDNEAWLGWHDHEFQEILKSAYALSSDSQVIKDLIKVQPWAHHFGGR